MFTSYSSGVTFEEFAAFIEDRLTKLEKFNAKRKAKSAAPTPREEEPAPPEAEVNILKVYDAMDMFKRLDKDKSETLDPTEMKELAHWVYTNFNAHGARLDDKQVQQCCLGAARSF